MSSLIARLTRFRRFRGSYGVAQAEQHEMSEVNLAGDLEPRYVPDVIVSDPVSCCTRPLLLLLVLCLLSFAGNVTMLAWITER